MIFFDETIHLFGLQSNKMKLWKQKKSIIIWNKKWTFLKKVTVDITISCLEGCWAAELFENVPCCALMLPIRGCEYKMRMMPSGEPSGHWFPCSISLHYENKERKEKNDMLCNKTQAEKISEELLTLLELAHTHIDSRRYFNGQETMKLRVNHVENESNQQK